MAYLGRGLDKISNIEVLDNITFDGSSSYSITKGSVAFTPNSAQSCLISIDGVVQATNFSVNSSTIDFGVAIPSTSVCNFFLHYGTGVMTVPSDGSVTTAKLGDGSVTTAKINDDAITKDKVSNLMYPAFYARLDGSQNVTDNAVTKVTLNEEYFDTDNCFDHTTNYRFTPTVAGKYCFYGQIWMDSGVTANNLQQANIYIYKNGANIAVSRIDARNTYTGRFNTKTTSFIASANGTSDYFELYGQVNNTSGTPAFYSTSSNIEGYTFFGAYRIGD